MTSLVKGSHTGLASLADAGLAATGLPLAALPSPNTPRWANHTSFRVDSVADEFQMRKESQTAHARLAEWTVRKAQWRKDRAEGKAPEVLKPQQNDRPEYVKKSVDRFYLLLF